MAITTADQIEEVHSLFSEFLHDRGQRRTPERMAVLDAVYSADGHLDADTLYTRLREGNVHVSRATVYNTLELLSECDLVTRHQFGNKQAKYERSYSFRQHDHLICMECGELFEFCDPRLQSVQEMVADVFGFEVSHHSLHIYGHCRREGCPSRPVGTSGS